MNLRDYMRVNSRRKVENLAKRAGTSHQYLYQMSLGHRRPSVEMAKKLVEASRGELDFVALLTFERPAEGFRVSA